MNDPGGVAAMGELERALGTGALFQAGRQRSKL